MYIYAVYYKNNNILTVKQGFNFFAALFNFVWAACQGMWLICFIGVILNLLVHWLQQYMFVVQNIFQFSGILFFGFLGNDLVEYYLLKRGYKLDKIILAKSALEAESKYYLINGKG